ncbi:hypothetical protein ACIGO6_38930 [Streptomyces sp. NPDC053750]|uniref:hypothetical protein n=1 Tax=Streptomyces sp. NPDC053750 TaxID=3365714 RepID=UPI0037CF0F74
MVGQPGLKRGSIEQACTTWHRATDHMDGVRAVRTRKAVSRMRSDLARFRARGLRCVAELDERGRDFLAGVRTQPHPEKRRTTGSR